MSRFLETIYIKGGLPRHLDWHQRRVEATLKYCYPTEFANEEPFQLEEILSACSPPGQGVYRCKVAYDFHTLSVEFFPYQSRIVNSLHLIEAPAGYDYSFKYAERLILEELYAQRGSADDILITKDGWITDTSIANIAFRKEDRWYTPSIPLLAGTTWKRLVKAGIITPRPIHQDDVGRYDAFKVFNAMNDWEEVAEVKVRGM